MKRLSLITIIILLPVIICAYTYTVKQDGTGDFTTIYDAFTCYDVQQNGGIIYVFPGVYENVPLFQVTPNSVNIQIIGTNKTTCIIDADYAFYGFEIYNVNSNLTIKNFTVQDASIAGFRINSGSYGNTIIENNNITNCGFQANASVQKSALICHGNALIKGNTFIDNYNNWDYWAHEEFSLGGAIYIDYHDASVTDGLIEITNNDFIGNFARDCGAIFATSNQVISISGNYFEGNGLLESTINNNVPQYCVIARFEDCNIVDFNSNICYNNESYEVQMGPSHEQQGLVFKDCTVAQIRNNTINQNLDLSATEGIKGIMINATNDEGAYNIINNIVFYNWDGINCMNDDYGSLNIDYNDIHNNPPAGGNNNYVNVTQGEHDILYYPDLDPLTFQPIWNSSTKSRCIDAGVPNLFDDDNTPSDIGAVCAIKHRIDVVDLPSPSVDNGLKWLSFPSLDDVYSTSSYDPDKAGDLLFDILFPFEDPELEYVKHENNYFVRQWQGNWQGTSNIFSKTNGYIFQMNEAATLEISGFKVSDNTHIKLDGNSYENWIGYWLEETQTLSDAFGDEWNTGNIYSIQHQDWSAYYSEGTWKYKTSYETDDPPTLSYADMVKVKCHNTISSFCWDNGTPEDSKSNFAEPEYYNYEEQIDYTPLFIELDETDLPQEIGAFVNGECIGATVVESDFTQINAYATSVNPGEIELELYYGSRSAMQNKTITNYKCISSDNPTKIQHSLHTGDNAEAWFVSLREDSSIIIPIVKLTLSNFPNPFNPTTTISYNIPLESKVSLEIYNIKGQHVKQLVSGSQPEGYYEVVWNGKDDAGKQVSSGIYYYRISACGKTLNKKMLMLK